MSFEDDFAIRVLGLGKTFRLYARPIDRLKQTLFGGRRDFGRSFVALDGVSFSVPKGRVLGVIGQNGAGKSTLLQLLCGTLTPSQGEIAVRGRIAALLELGAGFNPEFSGRENVFLNGAILGLSHAEIAARYDEIVAFSGVHKFIDQPVKTYSSGMYVRLAFAIATSVDPEILVIDEALSVGDGAFARKSFDRIMALRERGVTILFCSHSMYHIESICDQALWLEQGRVRMLGEPGMVTRAYTEHLLRVVAVGQSEVAPLVPETESAGTGIAPGVKVDIAGDASASGATVSAVSAGLAKLLAIEVAADGVAGHELTLRSGVSSLTVRVEVAFDSVLPTPALVFEFLTEGGVTVSSGSSLFDGAGARLISPGRAVFDLAFPNIPLMRGRYRMSFYLACERMLHVYDQAVGCVLLEVSQEHGERGVCFLRHQWQQAVA